MQAEVENNPLSVIQFKIETAMREMKEATGLIQEEQRRRRMRHGLGWKRCKELKAEEQKI